MWNYVIFVFESFFEMNDDIFQAFAFVAFWQKPNTCYSNFEESRTVFNFQSPRGAL